MKKTIAKVVHHVKRAASHPEHSEDVDSDVMDALLAPDPDPNALTEAAEILSKLASSTPAHMGTAHGISLIHAAQAWVAAHVEHE